MTNKNPKVLFVYFSFTHQTHKVVEAMSEVLRAKGCEVSHARIEFTGPRYTGIFSNFPPQPAFLKLISMLPPQMRRATREIHVPADMLEGEYDLVCFGSPTWWLTTSMPVRSFLKSEAAARLLKGRRFGAFVVCRRYWKENLRTVKHLGIENGGEYIGGAYFDFAGRQLASLLSFVSYMGAGINKPRCFGLKIPPTNLKPDYVSGAEAFANSLTAISLSS